MKVNLLVDVDAVEGGSFKIVAQHLITHSVRCPVVRRVIGVAASILRADLLLASHVQRLVDHVITQLMILKRSKRIDVIAAAEDESLEPLFFPS